MRIARLNGRSRDLLIPGAKLMGDALLAVMAYLCAFLARFDGILDHRLALLLTKTSPFVFVLTASALGVAGVHRLSWKYFGPRDFLRHAAALIMIDLLFFVPLFGFHLAFVPRSIPLLFLAFAMLLTGAPKLAFRYYKQSAVAGKNTVHRVLVIGAGSTGEMIVRQMLNEPRFGYRPVAFLDDDPAKRGSRIHGLPVVGSVDRVVEECQSRNVDLIIIAVPSASPAQMRRIVSLCQQTGLAFKTVPGIREIVNGGLGVSQLREISIEDLLDRAQVTVDTQAIASFLRGKRVLVTGAAGSIGSEICRQIVRHSECHLIGLDRSENGLFYLESDLSVIHPSRGRFDLIVCDVRETTKLARILSRFRPHLVFHAAAFKHVPIVEKNPGEAFENNFVATVRLAELCDEYGAEKFVFISTDKAVNPWSVMGATKRAAEMALSAFHTVSSTAFITVRFGNVLASEGSVIHVFRRQIARGGPVTVTHPEMRRYFMSISEAVRLVLEACRIGSGGETFILDMGEPVRILDLAEEMIRLADRRPYVDIPIVFTGPRPGEKLEEELWYADEVPVPSSHPKILKARTNGCLTWEEVTEILNIFAQCADLARDEVALDLLATLVPQYSPGPQGPDRPAPVPVGLGYTAESVQLGENSGRD